MLTGPQLAAGTFHGIDGVPLTSIIPSSTGGVSATACFHRGSSRSVQLFLACTHAHTFVWDRVHTTEKWGAQPMACPKLACPTPRRAKENLRCLVDIAVCV